jgi:hypothetical protein
MSDHLDRSGHAVPHFTTRKVTLLYLIVLQALPTMGVISLGAPSYAIFDQPIPWMGMSFVIGGVAFFLTYLASYPWRYRIIEGLIAPVTWLILHLAGKV